MVLEISPMVVEQKEVVMVVLMMGVAKMKVVVEDVEMEMKVVKDCYNILVLVNLSIYLIYFRE